MHGLLLDADLENMKLLVKMLFITYTASIQIFANLLSLSKELENERLAQLSSLFIIQVNYVLDNILMHAIEKFLHNNMCYQRTVHCKFCQVPCYSHDRRAWTVQLVTVYVPTS